MDRRAGDSAGVYRELRDGLDVTAELSHADLARRARAIADQLAPRVAPGSRALLMYPPGLEVLPAFFGCLYAGVVAVPVPPPDGARLKHSLPRLQAILDDVAPAAILTTAALFDDLAQRMQAALPTVDWLVTDRLDVDTAPGAMAPAGAGVETAVLAGRAAADPDALAYLQYTSGSTSQPRGVMLSHANVLHNLGHLRRGFACGRDSVCVTWMPYFHDYGLVEGLLQPLYSGADCYVMSPLTLLMRPLRWLQAIDRYAATHTHAPNFAYELCLQRITAEQRAGLNLSSWRVAGNGAEPVRLDTLRRFADTFAPQGLRRETLYPAYGLAEATLFVTARAHDTPFSALPVRADALERNRLVLAADDAPASQRRAVVACGRPQPGTDLRIVDPQTRTACPPDEIGEIWVADPSVAIGYWRKPEDTRAVLQARLDDDPAAGPFLRTGDLGFVHAGDLYVTGRLKDLIVIAGVNHYPQDVEWTVQAACPQLRRDHCAAFAVEVAGEERLVVVAEGERGLDDPEAALRGLRAAVAERHGVVVHHAAILKRGGIFKTSSGKLQRSACRAAFLDGRLSILAEWSADRDAPVPVPDPAPAPSAAADHDPVAARAEPPAAPDSGEVERVLRAELAQLLGLAPERIPRTAGFAELGLHSRLAAGFVAAVQDRLGLAALTPTVLWHHGNLAALAAHICHGAAPASSPSASSPSAPSPSATTSAAVRPTDGSAEPVAVIGQACRFPGAPDAAAFWKLLSEGRCAIRGDDRLPGVQAGFLEGVDGFDAALFGLSDDEARAMDPQQRLLLEVAWQALEHANLSPAALAGRPAGVFVGIATQDFAADAFSRADADRLIDAYTGTGMALSLAANRLSYHLDLRGPSLAIDTACSSSLVAVHQACQSLRQGECELALAGGVNLIGGPQLQLALERAGMLSPSGRCRTFDAGADGYVRGEGCGLVVLKPLAAALRDGDRVLATIRGSAVNQDGRSNGQTAPNPAAQRAVVRAALDRAGLEPSAIDYVEAHGTGTRLGDPIEVEALQQVLGTDRGPHQICLLGSVKTNLGHLEAAAGIAGLIKTVLSLQAGRLPAHLHVDRVNPLIRLEATAFQVVTAAQPFPSRADGAPRRAGVSSFGFGGTNAHVVLEQAPAAAAHEPGTARDTGAATDRPSRILPLSARGPEALRALAARYADYLETPGGADPADVAATAATCRAHHPERLTVAAADRAGLAARLRAVAAADASPDPAVQLGTAPDAAPRVAFLFSGQGAQVPGMARGLYDTDSQVRATLDTCERLLADVLDRPLLSVVFGDDPDLLEQTVYTQPALFAVEVALGQLWQRWGVRPAALLGHSVGEYAAACLAGVFDLETGLRLIAARGRLIQQLPKNGGMLAVMADEAQLTRALGTDRPDLAIAAVNGPRSLVLSGRREVLRDAADQLARAGLHGRMLPVSFAFHSPLLDPVLEPFRELAGQFGYDAPRVPLLSNLDGRPLTQAPDADYWTRHLRGTVRFADGLARLTGDHSAFLEVGPKPVLTTIGAQTHGDPRFMWLASLRPDADDRSVMLESLGRLYCAGIDPDWAAVTGVAQRARVFDLPTYPFQQRRFARPPRPAGNDAAAPVTRALQQIAEAHAATPGRLETPASDVPVPIEEWAYRTALTPEESAAPINSGADSAGAEPRQALPSQEWLLLADAGGAGDALARQLQAGGATCRQIDADAAIDDLVQALSAPGQADGAQPLQVCALWPLDLPNAGDADTAAVTRTADALATRLLALVQAAARSARPLGLWLVTRMAAAEAGAARPDGLATALVQGFGRSLRHEHPDWTVRLVGVHGTSANIARDLLAERTRTAAAEVAWIEGRRHIRCLVPAPLQPRSEPATLEHSWLIAGGLGPLGLAIADWLVERGVRHLLVTARHAPSAEAEARLAILRAQGAEVRTVAADVADAAALQATLDAIPADWPPLAGVVHAAGVRDDGLLHQATPGRVARVLRPKVAGAWNLHRLTQGLDLRHFVLMSSAAGVVGNAGQAAYAAGNAFMDALALYRRSHGLMAQSLSWSAWADAAADASVADRLAGHGLTPIQTTDGLAALERALAQDDPHLVLLPRRAGARLSAQLLGTPDTTAAPEAPAGPVPSDPAPAATALAAALQARLPERHADALEQHVLAAIAAQRGVPAETLAPTRGFFDLGLGSLALVELRNRLQHDLGRSLPTTIAFDHPTPRRLAQRLAALVGEAAAPRPAPPARPHSASAPSAHDSGGANAVAVIGMGCRMAGGIIDPESFWRVLEDGVDTIGEVPASRWDIDRLYDPDPAHPGTIVTRHGGFVAGIEDFDPLFFGISPREAPYIDPQQRLLLEVAWRTMEHAGVPAGDLDGTETGVFVGISLNDYLRRLTADPGLIQHFVASGNALSVAANRLSYTFGLEGPSVAVDTACSSSLVAVHQACQSLIGGECESAFAGGVNLLLDPSVSINHSRARMLAPDGRCKTFSAQADGFVRSEGCGLVLLKRLADARRDGDRVLAVLRGTAVNQDGRTGGLTVPNGPAQERVVRRALKRADLEPAEVDYVEAHGTGTALGDPIEVGALDAVYGAGREPAAKLAVGSVKTNLGHLESAAGIAGLQKTVLALNRGWIPRHLHAAALNPNIDWSARSVRVTTAGAPWPARDRPRRAGVSSFGFGGTNAHAIVEEAPPLPERARPELTRYLLPLSAKTSDALRTLAEAVAATLRQDTAHPADLCFTAARGRDHYSHRLAVLGDSCASLAEALTHWLDGCEDASVWHGIAPSTDRASAAGVSALDARQARPTDWQSLAQHYVAGETIDWRAVYRDVPVRRVDLPGHPFARARYWIDAPDAAGPAPGTYALDWRAVPAGGDVPASLSGRWLILADRHGLGAALAARLSALGASAELVAAHPAAGVTRTCDPRDPDAVARLLDGPEPPAAVVHLGAIDARYATDGADGDEPEAAQSLGLAPALALARGILARGLGSRLWLVTRDAVAARAHDQVTGAAQGCLWGFGRSLALEQPQISAGLIDLEAGGDPAAQSGRLAAILARDPADAAELALRGDAVLAPTLTPLAPMPSRHAAPGATVRAEGAYLITGGFGSLGGALARWLAGQGARELWLVGRRGGATGDAQALVAELEGLGARVRTAALDVADAPALTRQLADWRAGGTALRGVVHAAGQGDRTPIDALDWTTARAVLRAKVDGAWALHRACRADPLEMFVLIGSIAGLWGGQQQAAYAAANAALDALAAQRCARGLPALALDLGPVGESGMVSREVADELRRMGLHSMPVAHLTAVLASPLASQRAQLALVAADWPRFAELYRGRRPTRLFDELSPQTQPPEATVSHAAPTDLGGADALQAWLAGQLGTALKLAPERIDPDTAMTRQGLDSLLAIDLRNRIERELGIAVALKELLGTRTLAELARMLADEPPAGSDPDVTAAPPAGDEEWISGEL